jgi:hypothetical protein
MFRGFGETAAKLNPLEEELQAACITRKKVPLGALENLLNRCWNRAAHLDGIVLLFAFKAVQHWLFDQCS